MSNLTVAQKACVNSITVALSVKEKYRTMVGHIALEVADAFYELSKRGVSLKVNDQEGPKHGALSDEIHDFLLSVFDPTTDKEELKIARSVLRLILECNFSFSLKKEDDTTAGGTTPQA